MQLAGELVFLGVCGFLLGSFLYTGYYTTKYEPEVKHGYAVIGIGIAISVVVNVGVEIKYDASLWFRYGTLIGYACVAMGLILTIRTRRRMHKESHGFTSCD